jgi:uncharacterized SAM-binding protein YcdF (DUF218 family)
MTEAISHLLESICQPSALIVVTICAGTILVVLEQSRRATWCLTVGTIALVLCAWTPLIPSLMRPLEDRFPRAALPQHVTGIIVLGGAFDPSESLDRGTIALNYRAQRMTLFVKLARQYPTARLVFSGGKVDRRSAAPPEAQLARNFFDGFGIALDRVIFEGASRNTRENALFSRRLVRIRADDKWLLVTSAADMPRAVGCFRKVGWNTIAVPADYHTSKSLWAVPGVVSGLAELDWTSHEWIGLLYYRLRGWTPTFFPSPKVSDVT